MFSWIKSLFETKKPRKKHYWITEVEVKRVEEAIEEGQSKKVITKYYNISDDTYQRIKSRRHRYSTIEVQDEK